MGQLIIISGVSCAGKSTLLGNISKMFSSFYFPESLTTRSFSRRDISSKKIYDHVSEEEFIQKIEEDFFLEWQKVHHNYYGTPKSCLRQASNDKKDVCLDIDPKGALKLLRQKKLDYGFNVKGFFVWRDIHPLDNFTIPNLAKSVEINIKLRDEEMNDKKVQDRVRSAILEYAIVKKNSNLFTFIENKNGNPYSAIDEFSNHYLPTFYPV